MELQGILIPYKKGTIYGHSLHSLVLSPFCFLSTQQPARVEKVIIMNSKCGNIEDGNVEGACVLEGYTNRSVSLRATLPLEQKQAPVFLTATMGSSARCNQKYTQLC